MVNQQQQQQQAQAQHKQVPPSILSVACSQLRSALRKCPTDVQLYSSLAALVNPLYYATMYCRNNNNNNNNNNNSNNSNNNDNDNSIQSWAEILKQVLQYSTTLERYFELLHVPNSNNDTFLKQFHQDALRLHKVLDETGYFNSFAPSLSNVIILSNLIKSFDLNLLSSINHPSVQNLFVLLHSQPTLYNCLQFIFSSSTVADNNNNNNILKSAVIQSVHLYHQENFNLSTNSNSNDHNIINSQQYIPLNPNRFLMINNLKKAFISKLNNNTNNNNEHLLTFISSLLDSSFLSDTDLFIAFTDLNHPSSDLSDNGIHNSNKHIIYSCIQHQLHQWYLTKPEQHHHHYHHQQQPKQISKIFTLFDQYHRRLWCTNVTVKMYEVQQNTQSLYAHFSDAILRIRCHQHPNIVTFYSSYYPSSPSPPQQGNETTQSDYALVVTENMTTSLHDLYYEKNHRTLVTKQVRINIIKHMLSAIVSLHKVNIMHGRINLKSILCRLYNQQLYGLFKIDSPNCIDQLFHYPSFSSLALSDLIFLPPDKLHPDDQNNPHANFLSNDVWSLGILILFLLDDQSFMNSREHQYQDALQTHVKMYLNHGYLQMISKWLHSINDFQIINVLNQCFHLDPTKRITAKQLQDSLLPLLNDYMNNINVNNTTTNKIHLNQIITTPSAAHNHHVMNDSEVETPLNQPMDPSSSSQIQKNFHAEPQPTVKSSSQITNGHDSDVIIVSDDNGQQALKPQHQHSHAQVCTPRSMIENITLPIHNNKENRKAFNDPKFEANLMSIAARGAKRAANEVESARRRKRLRSDRYQPPLPPPQNNTAPPVPHPVPTLNNNCNNQQNVHNQNNTNAPISSSDDLLKAPLNMSLASTPVSNDNENTKKENIENEPGLDNAENNKENEETDNSWKNRVRVRSKRSRKSRLSMISSDSDSNEEKNASNNNDDNNVVQKNETIDVQYADIKQQDIIHDNDAKQISSLDGGAACSFVNIPIPSMMPQSLSHGSVPLYTPPVIPNSMHTSDSLSTDHKEPGSNSRKSHGNSNHKKGNSKATNNSKRKRRRTGSQAGQQSVSQDQKGDDNSILQDDAMVAPCPQSSPAPPPPSNLVSKGGRRDDNMYIITGKNDVTPPQISSPNNCTKKIKSHLDLVQKSTINTPKNQPGQDKLKVGIMYEEGLPPCNIRNCHHAVIQYEAAISEGNITAKYRLAKCCESGNGMKTKDFNRAAALYCEAIDQFEIRAAWDAARCCEHGIGMNVDLIRAANYYYLAARHCKQFEGYVKLGKILEKILSLIINKEIDDEVYGCADLFESEVKEEQKEKERDERKLIIEKHTFNYYDVAAKNGCVKGIVEVANCYAGGKGIRRSVPKAVEFYRNAASQGDPSAMLSLGLLHEDGNGIRRSVDLALKFYKKSAGLGHPPGQTALGQCYLWAYGVELDYDKARDLFTTASQNGHSLAMHELGMLYKEGHGVEKDPTKAAESFEMASNHGCEVSMVQLGECYYHGIGVAKKDLKKAYSYFKRASILGAAEGYRWLGDCYCDGSGTKTRLKKSIECYKKAIDLGSVVAITSLGKCYENGIGVPFNHTKAISLYKKASEHGDAVAENNLGLIYEKGQYVKQNFTKAVHHFQKAIQKGSMDAMCNLADCYANGTGVQKCMKTAIKWYEEGSKNNVPAAQCELGICYYQGKGIDVNYEFAIELFQKACQGDECEAFRQLGHAYLDGKGVNGRDESKGFQLIKKAATLENAKNLDACHDVALCYEYGIGCQTDLKRAQFFYQQAAQQGNKRACASLGNLLDKTGLYKESCQWHLKCHGKVPDDFTITDENDK